MKTTIQLICVTILIAFTGCGAINPTGIKPAAVEPGEDAVVVNAERIQKTSLFAYDRLINWELTHRDVLPVEVSRAVDKARDEFLPNWEASRAALKEYKERRGGDLSDINRLNTALSVAQSSFLRLTGSQSDGDIGSIFTSISQLSEAVQTLKK